MSKDLEASAIEPITELFIHSQETLLQTSRERPSEVAATAHATSHEGSTNSHPLIWRPTEPQFTKAIAEYYSVSRKTVQEWFQKVKEACPWLSDSDLKLPDERYTPIAVGLMGHYRTAGLPFKAWKTQLWEENPALVSAFQASQKPQPAPAPETAAHAQLEGERDMVPYQPQSGELERFAPPALKLRRFVSTEAFVTTAKQHAETALDVTQSNSDALTAALVNQMEQEGQKLGLTLFQAKYGTAHAVMADLEETLAKKSGLVATPPLPSG